MTTATRPQPVKLADLDPDTRALVLAMLRAETAKAKLTSTEAQGSAYLRPVPTRPLAKR